MPEQNNILTRLRQWLRGEARRQDETELDRTAQTDDFLREAMEGYRSLPTSNHAERTEALRNRLRQRAAPDHNIRTLPWLRIAAGLFVILVAVGGFYFLNQPTTPALAERETVERADGETKEIEAQDFAPQQAGNEGQRDEETKGQRDEETKGQRDEETKGQGMVDDSRPNTEEKTANQTLIEPQDLAAPQEDVAPPRDEIAALQEDRVPPPTDPVSSLPTRAITLSDGSALVRRGRIVDTAGQPVPGVELRSSEQGEVISLSDAQGLATLDTAVQRVIVERTGFQPVQWPVEKSANPYLQLQPTEAPSPASYSLKSRVRSAQPPMTLAYPSVGYDSLRRWLQERTTTPLQQLSFSFTVHRDGRLSDATPKDSSDQAYVEEIFSILQQGPVWVLPPGVDSIRVNYQF